MFEYGTLVAQSEQAVEIMVNAIKETSANFTNLAVYERLEVELIKKIHACVINFP